MNQSKNYIINTMFLKKNNKKPNRIKNLAKILYIKDLEETNN